MLLLRYAQVQTEIKTAASPVVAIVIHAFYEDVFAEILEELKGSDALPMKLYVTTPPEIERKSTSQDSWMNTSAYDRKLADTEF